MTTYKSPVDLDYAYITDATIHIPADFNERLTLKYTLELGRPVRRPVPVIDEQQKRVVLDYHLSVKTSASIDDAPEKSLDIALVVDGRVSADQKATLHMETEDVERWLEANAVSLLYAKARAYVEYISAMSPFGVYSLPTIDPYAFLDGLELDA